MMNMVEKFISGGTKLSFYKRMEKICKEKKRVALFVDMDGTIAEYRLYPKDYITT